MRRTMILLLALALLSSNMATAPTPAAATNVTPAPLTPQDTPTPLVGSGVSSYALAAPKIFWHTGVPVCPPALAAQPAAAYVETIKRIATYGSTVRQLYAEGRNCDQGQVRSNLVADASYVYFLTPTGLYRLSTDANPGDAPQLVNGLVSGYGELADGGDRTYYLNYSGNNSYIGYVLKSNNQRVFLTSYGTTNTSNLSTDGQYVYYIVSGALYRLKPGVDSGVQIASAVGGYYAEGRRLIYCTISPPQCFYSNNVYVGQGRTVHIYNNNTNSLGSAIYTSGDTTAQVYDITTDFSRLFVFERQQVACSPDPCFPSYNNVLMRMTRGGASPAPIYVYSAGALASDSRNLTTDGTYLFWQQNDTVQRMANDASTLPQINMRITGIEVTQGIQNLTNGVGLIKNRRTFLRLYVKSDGAAVPGVTARLSAPALGGTPLSPVNPVGTTISVRGSPNRNDINQSFLFELPWSWTQGASVALRADLNPYKIPLEPTYGDNASTITVSFKNSPKLSAEFFRLNYTVGGTTYRPRINKDVLQTYSWIMRAYPIGGTVGQNFKPRLWDVDGGTMLGGWVMRTSPECAVVYPKVDDRSLCASYFTNGWLKYYRDHGWVPNVTNFYYGMIDDGAKFPRGQAIYSQTSVGPSGSGDWGWDFDGSYADWYAGHEIGHSLGRAHPNAGSDNPATENTTENCGHSRSDPGFPYGNTSSAAAPIGPASGSMEGFDGGDPAFGIAKAVYPSASWNDVMSYCNNQWVSDYTYNAMYNYMIAHPSAASSMGRATPAVSGDFLSIAGVINPDANTAAFSLVRRLNTVAFQPPIAPGGYIIRLLNASSGVLADYNFTPSTPDDGGGLGFDQVVNFVAGTRTVQIVKQSGGQVLASKTVSANPPLLSNVALQGAPNPVSGVVTLGWTASDPDGDPLTFDIFYSRDNGTTFQPVKMNATGASTSIDTAALGGSGTAILRVVASDGVHTAEASSAPFVMANKPPQPYILTPGDDTHIHYGQLVNFSGMAFDAQDSTVADAGLVWKNAQGTTLGTGALISLDNLPVGSNEITLVATNSVGQSASASVTVIVDDDLDLPGPTLTAGPGQVGWHIAAGTTQAQTAQVTISNAGSGELNWTASSNQPWLTLSAANGTIDDGDPATLTLTANPSGLASEQAYSATLTLTKPASGSSPAQTVTIPVNLSVGDVWNTYDPPGNGVELRIYLPLVRR